MRTKLIVLFFFVLMGSFVFAQTNPEEKEDELKYKFFMDLGGYKSFLKNDTKYFGVNFGMKVKCKFKIGFSYGWLRRNYKTDLYPVDLLIYPNAELTTKTDAQFYSVLFEPFLIKEKKINVTLPIKVGVVDLTSDYKESALNYIEYYAENPIYGEVSLNIDFRVLGFMKFGFNLAYQYVMTDLAVANEALNTPLLGVNVKIGGMCKTDK